MKENAIANAQARQVQAKPSMAAYIQKMKTEIEKALPSVLTPERFTRITLSAISANPKLAETTPQSFLGAMMTAAQLGLEPNTPLGQAYLIPYRNKGILETQFQIGYKGLMDLAYRSGMISTISAHVVYERDEFSYALGLEPKLVHVPAMSNRGDPLAVYAVFRTKDGGFGFEVMSMEDVRMHAKRYSKSYAAGPWQSNFEEMAKKTVLKRVLKYAPLKSEFVRALAADGSIKHTISEDMFDEPDQMVYEEELPVAVDVREEDSAEHGCGQIAQEQVEAGRDA